MRYVIALSASVALSGFWLILFIELRKVRYEDYERDYNPWFDYLYIYGFVVCSALTSYGVSSQIGA